MISPFYKGQSGARNFHQCKFPGIGLLYAILPFFTRGSFHDSNPRPPGHTAITLLLCKICFYVPSIHANHPNKSLHGTAYLDIPWNSRHRINNADRTCKPIVWVLLGSYSNYNQQTTLLVSKIKLKFTIQISIFWIKSVITIHWKSWLLSWSLIWMSNQILEQEEIGNEWERRMT